jgi:hypothetical protein
MPPLRTGDFVVGKFVESINDITIGKTYILVTTTEGIVYKRVMQKDDGMLELHSDNKLYNPYSVNCHDILEVWEFVSSIKISDKKEVEKMDVVMDLLVELKNEFAKVIKV